MSTPSLKSAYKALAKASPFKIDDTVTVVATATTQQMGWDNCWIPDMDDFVGRTGTVIGTDSGSGVHVVFDSGDPRTCDDNYHFPFFVLRRSVPTAKIVNLPNGTATIRRIDDQYKVTGVDFELTVEDLDVLAKAVRKFQKEVESFKA